MTYKAFQVVLRLGAPLHVGWRQVGNLWQTRPYILAHQVLAALATRCTEWSLGGEIESGSNPYLRRLAWLKKNVVVTYFFPSLEKDPANSYLPCFKNSGRLYWEIGNSEEALSREEFEYLFFDAEMRTALDYRRAAAQESSLYCMEYVRPWTRETEMNQKKNCWPVYFAGYVFLTEEAEKEFNKAKTKLKVQNLKEVLRYLFNYLQIGGERKYGWGLLLASEGAVEECPLPNELFGRKGLSLSVYNEGDGKIELHVKVEKDQPVLAHVRHEEAKGRITGPVEVLVHRSTVEDKAGCHYGKNISLFICYPPGSKCEGENTFKITPEGLWQWLN